ncbi:hypothetical protein EV426DRAFT_700130 [Tirmania nivea]|nr:hypothetical protein EV426DRAFT_700130 [Tirmania nivea]
MVPPQPPEVANTRPSAIPEAFMDHHGEPSDLQLTEPSYRTVSTIRAAIVLCSIIAGNCLCSGFICLCLWGFSKMNDLSQWEKGAFNTLLLLLSVVLAFGIGFLFDQIGLLARGTLLQHTGCCVEGIGYVMRGTLSSYASLFMHKVGISGVVFLYLLCSVVGRFGVVTLGFAFNIEESPPPLFRPDWAKGAVNSDYLPGSEFRVRYIFEYGRGSSEICSLAQILKGPWGNNGEYIGESPMDLSPFSNENLAMNVSEGNKVSFRYKFRDFRGKTAVYSGWEGLIETQCRRVGAIRDVVLGPTALNFTRAPLRRQYRWIIAEAQVAQSNVDPGFRHQVVEIWLVGGPGGILFNCSLFFIDSYTNSRPVASLNSYSRPAPQPAPAASPEEHMLGGYIYQKLKRGPILKEGLGWTITTYGLEDDIDFDATSGFGTGVNQKSQSASEVWLSAYIGNYIGNYLGFLNDVLQQTKIEHETQGATKLVVKWERVAGTLGGLVVLQLTFGLAALTYCRRNFEIVDDVSTFSSMFTGFPFNPKAARRKEGAAYQGRFVAEGDAFRWVFGAGKEKDKVAYQ